MRRGDVTLDVPPEDDWDDLRLTPLGRLLLLAVLATNVVFRFGAFWDISFSTLAEAKLERCAALLLGPAPEVPAGDPPSGVPASSLEAIEASRGVSWDEDASPEGPFDNGDKTRAVCRLYDPSFGFFKIGGKKVTLRCSLRGEMSGSPLRTVSTVEVRPSTASAPPRSPRAG